MYEPVLHLIQQLENRLSLTTLTDATMKTLEYERDILIQLSLAVTSRQQMVSDELYRRYLNEQVNRHMETIFDKYNDLSPEETMFVKEWLPHMTVVHASRLTEFTLRIRKKWSLFEQSWKDALLECTNLNQNMTNIVVNFLCASDKQRPSMDIGLRFVFGENGVSLVTIGANNDRTYLEGTNEGEVGRGRNAWSQRHKQGNPFLASPLTSIRKLFPWEPENHYIYGSIIWSFFNWIHEFESMRDFVGRLLRC